MEDSMRAFLLAIVTMMAMVLSAQTDVSAQTAKPANTAKPAKPADTAKKTPETPKAVKTAKAPKAGGAAKAQATAANPVNLNSASAAQFQTLPGVGASTAQRIVDYRQKNGSFKKVEELMNVKGIGEKSFLKLKPLITVAGEKGDRAGAEK
jgi:competence protein ComEA